VQYQGRTSELHLEDSVAVHICLYELHFNKSEAKD